MTIRELESLLSSKGFEVFENRDNYAAYRKEFAPGIGIDVIVFTEIPLIYSSAYLCFNELFPTLKFGGKRYVGIAYIDSNGIVGQGDKYDSDKLKQTYEEHKRALEAELAIITSINPHFD